jgi:glycosyltransferase involved in cell wall biosynthesis
LLGDGAVLVQAGDVAELHDAVIELLDDPARRQAIAKAGYEQAALWPSDVDTITQVIGVYRELVDSAPDSASDRDAGER